MRVDLFDFHLPPELIAERHVVPRDSARLLHVGVAKSPADCTVGDLPKLLRPGDLLVVNDTRVIPARLLGVRGEVPVELLLHRSVEGEGSDVRWLAFAKQGKRLKVGQAIAFAEGLDASVEAKTEDGLVRVRFNRTAAELLTTLQRIGHMPLPPYIRRPDGETDRGDYQTMYAARDGAVAAPTAGLHFTPELLAGLYDAGVTRAAVTLHVGAGTFLPVKVDDTDHHVMHAEWGEVTADTAAAVAAVHARGGRVVAVGTTSLRVLESAAGDSGVVAPFNGDTALFITPGYRFMAVDVLMTNFHLPRSTLYMLVSAFAGVEAMVAAYAHAIARGYRFYSYGDACLLERNDR